MKLKTEFIVLFFWLMALILIFGPEALAKEDVVTLIKYEAAQQGFDPELAVAIATVESGLNPKAVGALGEIGLFQLRPEYHNVVKGETIKNIRAGIKYLIYVQELCKEDYPKLSWVNCFNHGPHMRVKYPLKFRYYKKVYTEYMSLKLRKIEYVSI